MRIVVLAGGIGGARFLRGLKQAAPDADITVIGNTGDDIHLFGLKVCPDLDTVMYTLGGGINEEQGWGRTDETFHLKEELAAYGVGPKWFGLGDRDFATHIVRTQMLGAGYPLSAVTEALCDRWKPGVRLIPMTDDRVETHVAVTLPEGDGSGDEGAGSGERRAIHFQEYWVRLRASVPAEAIVPVGAEQAKPAPGVLEAIGAADVILFPPSNPVVSIGTILAVPGIREAIADAGVPVVGLSPIVGGAPVRGMADKVLAAVGVESTAAAVAEHYGSGLLDGWLVDTADAEAVEQVEAAGIRCRAVPLMMTDVDAAAAMAREALTLAGEVRAL
ncbi:2-phospho-L-lactate transferase [Streptomyces sp. SID7958]|uniref:Phosphoenolpyruvate transferase n=2 Tax=unclassified Streptomyces TaxID=2593676 RepID=A0A6G3QUF3_9ACTN|nr:MULTISPECIES: 2-phospho-L-lactate transferase [unclassified Streptomyces]NEA86962.1 2-phospho-L-lactate transferase [Streptomyces sp. SID14436]NEC83618.1 2-phospho-L-lactate transferase [Streptomyces sp. SID7958]